LVAKGFKPGQYKQNRERAKKPLQKKPIEHKTENIPKKLEGETPGIKKYNPPILANKGL